MTSEPDLHNLNVHNRATRRLAARRTTPKRPSCGVTKPHDGRWIPPVDPIAFECRALRRAAQKARRRAIKRGIYSDPNENLDWAF